MPETGTLNSEILGNTQVVSTEPRAYFFCYEASRNKEIKSVGEGIWAVTNFISRSSHSASSLHISGTFYGNWVTPIQASVPHIPRLGRTAQRQTIKYNLILDREESLRTLLRNLERSQEMAYLKSIADIGEDAETYFSRHKSIRNFVIKVLNKIKNAVSPIYGSYKISANLMYDRETVDWEALVLTLYIRESNFEKRIQVWNQLGRSVELIIEQLNLDNRQEVKLLREIYDKLVVEVNNWGDV